MPANFQRSFKQTVLISGATGGLGKAFAVECASRGWDLFLTDRSQPALDMLANSLSAGYGIKTGTCACDLTNEHSRLKLFADLDQTFSSLTMLINVAGVDHEGMFLDQSGEQINSIVRLNIESTLAMIHALVPRRDPFTKFRVINVASMAAFYAMPVKAVYAASKRFLLDVTLALQEEMKVHNVGFTVLCPAGMPTNQECIHAIEGQGLMGQITTMDVGRVAYQTIESSLHDRKVVIPGMINRIIRSIGSMVPARLVTYLIGKRWSKVRIERSQKGTLPAAQAAVLKF